MKVTMTMKTIIFLCIIIIASVIVFFTYKKIEPFDNHCPTTLIKEGDHFLLYNPFLFIIIIIINLYVNIINYISFYYVL
jgi:hypothetical protein